MVRGISRRVIVVDSPDTELFEQAIFIVRNDALHQSGVTAQHIVGEACRLVKSYGAPRKNHALHRFAPLLYSALGALSIALVWLATVLL